MIEARNRCLAAASTCRVVTNFFASLLRSLFPTLAPFFPKRNSPTRMVCDLRFNSQLCMYVHIYIYIVEREKEREKERERMFICVCICKYMYVRLNCELDSCDCAYLMMYMLVLVRVRLHVRVSFYVCAKGFRVVYARTRMYV